MRGWVAAGLVIFAILWLAGSFDKALAPYGLNWGECATNGFGATFCGDDLDRYREDVVNPLREYERAPAPPKTSWDRAWEESPYASRYP